MKISSKSASSDRYVASRSKSAPKNVFTNSLVQSRLQPEPHPLEILYKPSLSSRDGSETLSASTKDTGIFNFIQNTVSKSTISSQTIPRIRPYQMLDAESVIDDHYLNNLDVAKNDFLALGLRWKLILLKGKELKMFGFERRKENILTCVKFSSSEQAIFTGDELGYAEFFDIEKMISMRHFRAHALRVGRFENFSSSHDKIFTGSKDYETKFHDLKLKKTVINTFKSQKSEVTGLAEKNHLLATGYNNGKLVIWDVRNSAKEMITLENHIGAVKALSWCPWRANTLVSGGGKKNTGIVVFNSSDQIVEGRIPTKNQISEICWRESTKQMLFSESRIEPTKRVGKIRVSNYFNPRGKRVKFQEMDGRVLALKVNPSSDNLIMSLSGKELLAYWDVDKAVEKVSAAEMIECVECV